MLADNSFQPRDKRKDLLAWFDKARQNAGKTASRCTKTNGLQKSSSYRRRKRGNS